MRVKFTHYITNNSCRFFVTRTFEDLYYERLLLYNQVANVHFNLEFQSFQKACDNLNINKKLKYIKEYIDYDENIDFLNKPSVVGGSISYKSICKAAELYKNKVVKAIVTAPISKESLHLAGH